MNRAVVWALAVMSLVERGSLALDDSVAAHLPEYAGTDKAALTVEQLLTHTSGIPGQQPLWRSPGCATAAGRLRRNQGASSTALEARIARRQG